VNVEHTRDMIALEAERRSTKKGSIDLDQRLAMGGSRDDTMDPRFGRHIVSEGKKDRNSRGGGGWKADQGQIVGIFQIHNRSNNLQEEYNKLEAVDVDIVGVLRIEFDASYNSWGPTAIEPKTKAIVDGTTTCLASVTSAPVVRRARDDMAD